MRFRAETALAGLLLASCTAIPHRAPLQTTWRAPPIALGDGAVKIGAAYTLAGQRYTPSDAGEFEQIGLASWYGDELRGSRTANGEAFDPDGISAAHPTLPMPSYVEVTSLDSGRTILVRINDRGPFHGNRIIDLSIGAARQLGMTGHGARPVRVRRVYPSESDKMALRSGDRVAERSFPSASDLGRMRSRAEWRAPVNASVAIPPGAGPLWIQIASFSSRDRAESMAGRLGGVISPQGGIYRVRMGPYESARDANAALAPLAAKGYPDVIIVR